MESILKKIWCLLVIIILMIFPTFVSADEIISYLEYTNVKSGESGIGGSASYNDEECFDYQFYMSDESNYSFDLKGYNLDSDETYILKLTSDFIDYKVSYTGEELMEGVSITGDDGDSIMFSNVYIGESDEKVKVRVSANDRYYYIDETSFRFNDNFDSKEIDDYFKKIAPKGIIELNSVAIDDPAFMETCISAALSKYNTDKFWVYGYCEEGYENCSLSISDTTYTYRSKNFDIEYKFMKTDNEILTKVEKYIDKFEGDQENFEPNLFILDDLENINYKYSVIKHGKENINVINSTINYSSEIKKLLDYGNLTAIIDTRAGWEEEFTAGGFGFLNLLYDDVIYGVANQVGVKQINVLYIDDSTTNDRESYIEAALKRVQDYLPNAKVKLTYAGKINEIDQTNLMVPISELIDVNKTLGEYYTLTIDGVDHSFFIVKDSSKMKYPEMNTVDLKTNIKINSDSFEVPLDSKISANTVDNNSEEYKDIMKKLKLNNGMMYDLKLYSTSLETYVKKLENGKFRVFIPINEKYLNKDLKAYYVRDDGFIEIYDILKENGFAIFETDHFSTYTIGASDFVNPKTGDNIIIWIILALVSIIGLIFLLKLNKNK